MKTAYGHGAYGAGVYGGNQPSVYAEGLDALVALIADALPGVRVTRDPSAANPPCVLVAFPTAFGFTQGGRTASVPVVLLHAPPADLDTLDWLLDTYEALAYLVAGAGGPVVVGPYQVGALYFPSVTITAELSIQ